MAFTGEEIVRSRRDIGCTVIQPVPAPFSCHSDFACDGVENEFCAFEFPWCEGCPKSLLEKAGSLEDPLTSTVWLSWANGLAAATK